MDDLNRWLLQTCLPHWLARGVDQMAGGFHESLAHDTYICTSDFRRLRVAARQTYVFARAHEAGVAGAADAVSVGIDFLLHRAAQEDGGYAARFDLAGRPIDQARDLYDHAFVLFALAAAQPVLPHMALRRAALDLHQYILGSFGHRAGGFAESLPAMLPRRQNPHMHLLEATLAAYRAFGDAEFLATARGLVELCLTRFIDPASGALLEYFAEDWAAQHFGSPIVIEPGHCCEWAWLLGEYQAVAGADAAIAAAASRLMVFVDRHGAHPGTGDLVDAVTPLGAPIASTARLWPQSERLKAELVRPDAKLARQMHAAQRVASWLRPDGMWIERRDENGCDIPAPSPASTLYHLTCALLLLPSAATSTPAALLKAASFARTS